MKILIVEDSKFTRALLRRELATEHDVLEASNGNEGLLLLSERDPDLVLVDLLMPRMDGFEFLQRVRELGSDVPVVVCSANTQPSVEARIRELGGTAFVAKPELLVRGRALELASRLVKAPDDHPGIGVLMERGLLERALAAGESMLSRITGLPVTALSASLNGDDEASTETGDGVDVIMKLSGTMEGTSSVRLFGQGILDAAVAHLGPFEEGELPDDLAGEMGNLLINAFVSHFAQASGQEVAFSDPVTTQADRNAEAANTDSIRLRARFSVRGIPEPVTLSLTMSPNAFKEVVQKIRRKDGITA